jgi:hypothetical protein
MLTNSSSKLQNLLKYRAFSYSLEEFYELQDRTEANWVTEAIYKNE